MKNRGLIRDLEVFFRVSPEPNRSKVWLLIKKQLLDVGRWKVSGRGNPKKGFEKGWGKNKVDSTDF